MNVTRTPDFYAAYKTSAANPTNFQHYHDSYEIGFFINANLQVFIKDTRYEIHDGDIIFLNDYVIHRFIYDNISTVYNRYVINFKREYIQPMLAAAGAENLLDLFRNSSNIKITTTLKERSKLESLFKSIIHLQNESSDNISDAAAKSCLVIILTRIWQLMSAQKPAAKTGKKEKLIQSIIQYIDANYKHNINLDLLEKKFFIDKYHISHTFKEITGFTVMEYVQQRRINEAQKMLIHSSNEIFDICLDCGFNNLQHFYRVFKKISGVTPDKYRKLSF